MNASTFFPNGFAFSVFILELLDIMLIFVVLKIGNYQLISNSMKKVYLLFSFMMIVLTACQSLPAPKSNMAVVDYSVLTNQGVFITESNSVSFPYKPIGSVSIDELGGWVRKADKKRTEYMREDYYSSSSSSGGRQVYKQVYQAPEINDMFNKLAAQLHELGANGIINLRITQTFEYSKEVKQSIHRVTISGMAIKK